ncbi:secretin and TonB N-terminal domain-containing protein [Acinetobacter pittii]|uniref:secretin and TonB N-terminal domain-containing protein n=1 Tax=Acinetobacter pittii TaxID=48296 RepID=UPI003260F469
MNLPQTKLTVVTLSFLMLGGCSIAHLSQHEKELKKLDKLKKEADKKPASHRIDYVFEQQQMINYRISQAEKARSQGNLEMALLQYQQILEIDPHNIVAQEGIQKLKQIDQVKPLFDLAKSSYEKGNFEAALTILKEVIKTAPDLQQAVNLKFDIERELNRKILNPPLASERLEQRVSLEFRNAPVQAVMELLSQHSGINFILDKDTRLEQTTTIYAKETTVQEALDMIVRTSNLGYKMLNANTFLIYQDTPEKKKIYEELITRSFYLGNADAQRAQEMVSKLYEPKAMFFDNSLKMLVIRDTKQVVESIEKVLEAYDLPMSEVVLDIEVLEVNRDTLLGLGITFPDQVKVSALNPIGEVGKYTLNQLKNMTSDSLSLVTADTLATLNFKQTSTKTNLLANPRIRVKSKEEASFLIGDKVPVVTTTVGQNSGFVSESVNYLDVGLKVEVKPEVNKDRQVQIAIKLEVSNIAKEIATKNGLVYQIGTRNASTTLQLHDGETQMLAGLIRDDIKTSATHLPGFGKLPLLGRLFSNTTDSKNKSEIVLLITPRIVRPYSLPAPHIQEFISGTGSQVTTRPLRLTDHSTYLPQAQAMPEQVIESQSTNKVMENNISTIASQASQPITFDKKADFQLSGPSNVIPGQEFTLALIQNTPAFQSLSLDVRHPESWELVKIVNIAPTTRIDQEKNNSGTKLTFGATPQHQGPIALLTFKVPAKQPNQKENIVIENGKINLNDGKGEQALSDKVVKEFELNQ